MGLAAPDLTAQQAKLAEIVASETAKTVTRAGELAGYQHRESTSRALRSATVQRKIAELRGEKHVTVRSIHNLTAKKVKTIAENATDERTIMGLWQASGDLIAKGIGEDDDAPESPAETRRRFYLVALRMTRRILAHLAKYPEETAATMDAINARLVELGTIAPHASQD